MHLFVQHVVWRMGIYIPSIVEIIKNKKLISKKQKIMSIINVYDTAKAARQNNSEEKDSRANGWLFSYRTKVLIIQLVLSTSVVLFSIS